MSLIRDRINGAAKARRFMDGHEPDWIRKAAEYVNADEQAKWDEAVETVTLGALQPGDGFRLVEGSSTATHGTVTGTATGIGMVMVDTGTGNRYLPDTTPVQA
jgi:hypothetical protein